MIRTVFYGSVHEGHPIDHTLMDRSSISRSGPRTQNSQDSQGRSGLPLMVRSSYAKDGPSHQGPNLEPFLIPIRLVENFQFCSFRIQLYSNHSETLGIQLGLIHNYLLTLESIGQHPIFSNSLFALRPCRKCSK